ncbi:sporulation initiation phosphotransferase F [bacterium BMS3Abin14]|nr:sporulation initiation phosphotransferase F [bacterium BMS3Abin14]
MRGKNQAVLVVDDCQGILDTLETILGDDFQVMVALNATRAMKILSRVTPAMIFLDCMMPGFNGFQLLREIKQMSIESKIVVITASIFDEILEEIDWLGVDGLVQKPFDVSQIIDVTEKLMLQAS